MPRSKKPLDLTETDIALLQGLADGQKLTDIAAELHLNSWALRYRITVIKRALPAKNFVNLIAEAIRKGHID